MPGRMHASVPANVLEALAQLRREVEDELKGLAEKRSGLASELEALDKDIEARQRQLDMVEATERQLAGQGRGQRGLEGGAAGASTQVRDFSQAEL
jgi:hypothetical protein